MKNYFKFLKIYFYECMGLICFSKTLKMLSHWNVNDILDYLSDITKCEKERTVKVGISFLQSYCS